MFCFNVFIFVSFSIAFCRILISKSYFSIVYKCFCSVKLKIEFNAIKRNYFCLPNHKNLLCISKNVGRKKYSIFDISKNICFINKDKNSRNNIFLKTKKKKRLNIHKKCRKIHQLINHQFLPIFENYKRKIYKIL